MVRLTLEELAQVCEGRGLADHPVPTHKLLTNVTERLVVDHTPQVMCDLEGVLDREVVPVAQADQLLLLALIVHTHTHTDIPATLHTLVLPVLVCVPVRIPLALSSVSVSVSVGIGAASCIRLGLSLSLGCGVLCYPLRNGEG
eukprot:TRINITY_DN12528_c0_g1::TRINITY_DN12528_c0_g1_i1::g.2656::m.2656 TRINITY_DN12528_c0_g1::TRINITY_DN12528_c0_g1_i1::g.2656  ORF type:complete len:143 (-),score=12.38 TRINITY_DN12528_c0_g1_i1:189-617(-)